MTAISEVSILIASQGHIGMQASVPMELVPIAAGSLMSVVSATCAIFLALGQTIFQDRLNTHLSGQISSQLIDRILASGATNIRSFIDPDVLPTVLDGYSKSITEVFVSWFISLSLPELIILP